MPTHRRQPSFRRSLVRAAVAPALAFALFAGGELGSAVGTALRPQPSAPDQDADRAIGQVLISDRAEMNVPRWTRATGRRFPGCEAHAHHQQHHPRVVPAALVVVGLDGTLRRLPFDEVWARSTDDRPGNDVWVVGACHADDTEQP